MSKQANLAEMFLNGNSKRRKDVEKECNCYPNQIYQVYSKNENGKDWFVVVAFRSKNGSDFPVSERALQRAEQSLGAGKVSNSYVVVADRPATNEKPHFIHRDTLLNMKTKMRNVPPQQYVDELGPCWFINENMELVGMAMREVYDYDM
jgi:hypothetical protein